MRFRRGRLRERRPRRGVGGPGSKEFARWLNAWFRGYGHRFIRANFGVPAAVCCRCDLLVTVWGRVSSPDFTWLPEHRVRDRASPHELRKYMLALVPRCGEVAVQFIMRT